MEDPEHSQFSQGRIISKWPSQGQGSSGLTPHYAAFRGLGHNVLLTICNQHVNGQPHKFHRTWWFLWHIFLAFETINSTVTKIQEEIIHLSLIAVIQYLKYISITQTVLLNTPQKYRSKDVCNIYLIQNQMVFKIPQLGPQCNHEVFKQIYQNQDFRKRVLLWGWGGWGDGGRRLE